MLDSLAPGHDDDAVDDLYRSGMALGIAHHALLERRIGQRNAIVDEDCHAMPLVWLAACKRCHQAWIVRIKHVPCKIDWIIVAYFERLLILARSGRRSLYLQHS